MKDCVELSRQTGVEQSHRLKGNLSYSSHDSGPSSSVEFPCALRNCLVLAVVLVICFASPLFNLGRFAFDSDLFSYILLIPFISLYLVWQRREDLKRGTASEYKLSVVFAGAALALLISYWFALRFGYVSDPAACLAWSTLGFLLFFVAVCLFSLGRKVVARFAFPIGFLTFMIPFPTRVTESIELFLQHSSAITAQLLFGICGMPVVREGLVFQLPGIGLEVAPECSGIHSTLVLFITSALAGQLFLKTPWKRAVLCLAVIPLGILRNAVRICTIGQLCVHISPDMINSPIHRRGGPLFFILSLIPLFLFLYALRRSEDSARARA